MKRVHAWDTETVDLEVKEQSPVGNGKAISAQIFCGPDAGFSNGPRVFIDNFGECKDLLMEFKDYFEDNSVKKVWFNYGFDRHILYNHGIDAKGFGGDVMHMARLIDGSREPPAYSLSKISAYYHKEIQQLKNLIVVGLEQRNQLTVTERQSLNVYKDMYMNREIKINMNKLFAKRRMLKTGEPGKSFEVS